MATPDETGDKPAEIQQQGDSPDSLTLVDLFDRMDREAFRRVIREHDRPEQHARSS